MRGNSLWIALGTFLVIALSASDANAGHLLSTGSGFQNGPLYVSFSNVNNGTPFRTAAGSIGLAPKASIDGTPLPFMYCVEFFTDIYVPGTYNVTYGRDGVVHGYVVPNAGKIAWLLDHFGASATTQDLQEGLQAAIWKQIYGAAFNVAPTSAGTGAGILAAYNADIAALGNNSAPVGDLLWISPTNADGSYAQAQVTITPIGSTNSLQLLTAPAVPEPGTIGAALSGIGLGIITLGRKFRV